MTPISRANATRRGLPRYFTGKPCLRGHRAERLVRSGNCLECHRAFDEARYAAHPQCVRAQARAWYAAHPDRAAARFGLLRARRIAPDCVPDDVDFEATIPLYAKARRRTRETGVLYVVDHIIALCLRGQHIASNLQVITEAANREKAKTERKRPRT
jgi:hypothetical protein